jgi:hypothetical protein
MDKFRRADVEGSLQDFNQAQELDPGLRPYLWQRGLSLYYAGLRSAPLNNACRALHSIGRPQNPRRVGLEETTFLFHMQSSTRRLRSSSGTTLQ